jgi:hypothetical protein
VRELPRKNSEAAVVRFLEILASPKLVQRVNAECRHDIVCHKAAPWTRHEQLSLVRLAANNARCNPAHFLKGFPMLFHPSRTSATLTATHIRLRAKLDCFEATQAQFREWVSKIREEAAGRDTVAIECMAAEVETVIAADPKPVDDPPPDAEMTVERLRARANEAITQKDFGAFVGPGPVRVLTKATTTFGRVSPKCKPDIDLSDLNLQSISRFHCTVSLASDLNFYLNCLGSAVIINGCIFAKETVIRLNDRDLIDIGGAFFIFFENQALLQQLRNIH